MAAPFCTACGAAIAPGTRFCVKCGQRVEDMPPPSVAETVIFPRPVAPVPPPPPPPVVAAPPPFVQPPPPPAAPPPISQPFVAPPTPVKDGPGAGVWIGIFGILLLVVGAGLWFYTTQTHKAATEQVAVAPVSPTPVPTPTPVSTFVPAPTPTATTEVIPPNPDQVSNSARPEAPKPSTAPKATVVPVTRPAPQVDPAPAPTPPVKTAPPTSGVLHAAVEVAQNGEVVFENLPGARLKFTFDHSAWQPTISHQPNGTQTLVMRSLKPGIQKTCDVRWEIVQ